MSGNPPFGTRPACNGWHKPALSPVEDGARQGVTPSESVELRVTHSCTARSSVQPPGRRGPWSRDQAWEARQGPREARPGRARRPRAPTGSAMAPRRFLAAHRCYAVMASMGPERLRQPQRGHGVLLRGMQIDVRTAAAGPPRGAAHLDPRSWPGGNGPSPSAQPRTSDPDREQPPDHSTCARRSTAADTYPYSSTLLLYAALWFRGDITERPDADGGTVGQVR